MAMFDPDIFFEQQMQCWPEVRERYQQLADSKRRTLKVDGFEYLLSFNPARAISAKAKVVNGKALTKDGKAGEERPCFLCDAALPKQQLRYEVETLPLHHRYHIAVNPYPIVDHHFTIVFNEHTRQEIKGRLWDMAYFADLMPDYLIFFNGACSGASAPDHMHFQAVPKRLLPMVNWSEDQKTQIGVTQQMPHIEDSDFKNVMTWTDGSNAYWLVVNRKVHRPTQYFLADDDPNKVIFSPGSLEFCGVIPLCREEDYDKLDADILSNMLSQCALREPMIHVGIMEGQQIRFSADERVHSMNYLADDSMKDVLDYDSNRAEIQEMNEYWCHTEPFTLEGVTIGKQFHWQQQEDQIFRGSLHIIAKEGQLHAINVIPVEEYLKSVISSEMAATNSLELLKAHAIISRSWVLRQLGPKNLTNSANEEIQISQNSLVERLIKIWDHTDHHLYDVCADDHCQRYQGITRETNPLVTEAINATRGMILADETGKICDARFSKCCGGKTELFSTCWQDKDYSYLQSVDDPYCSLEFIAQLPGGMDSVLSQVLNNYDQQTVDFHDWEVTYSRKELNELIEKKLGMTIGEVQSLEPIERGESGRVKFLRIIGSFKTIEIGKELLIRKALSETHLYSSWFDIEQKDDKFILRGHGWGHGVGLCQIGAAAMALKGFKAEEILAHYYPGAMLKQLY